jgi:hypothetical protein
MRTTQGAQNGGDDKIRMRAGRDGEHEELLNEIFEPDPEESQISVQGPFKIAR